MHGTPVIPPCPIARCASELTDFIAMKTSVSNFLGTLFGLLGRRGGRNMHQRVLGTFANLAYLCVLGDSSAAWARLLRSVYATVPYMT